MMNESCNPDEILVRAMNAFRMESAARSAIDRCVSAVLTEAAQRPAPNVRLRWTVRLLGAGAIAAAACAVFLFPRQASALDSLRQVIKAEDPNVFQHTKQYTVQPDGSRRPIVEAYSVRGRYRLIFPDGGQQLVENGDYTVLLSSGDALVFHHFHGRAFEPVSIKQLLNQGGTADNVSLDRAGRLEGKTVDTYLVRGSFKDAKHKGLTYTFTLDVDPATKRPLRLRGGVAGLAAVESDFDYPAYSPDYFKLPITSKTHVVDKGDYMEYRKNGENK